MLLESCHRGRARKSVRRPFPPLRLSGPGLALVGEAFVQAQDVALGVGEPRGPRVGRCGYAVDGLVLRGVLVEEAYSAAIQRPGRHHGWEHEIEARESTVARVRHSPAQVRQ